MLVIFKDTIVRCWDFILWLAVLKLIFLKKTQKLCSSSCYSASLIQNIGQFGAILKAIEQLMQYTVLQIQSRSLKYTAVIKIRNNLSNFPFLSKQYKAITVCWCKLPTSNSFQTCLYYIYLLKLYDKSIIILLTNDLTNICANISKIWLILWMLYNCSLKGLKEVRKLGRNECALHRWSRSSVMSDCSRPYQ